MFVAFQKRKENISEYVLYLYQVEDIIRALGYEEQRIGEFVRANYQLSAIEQNEVIGWYTNIAEEIRNESPQILMHHTALQQTLSEIQQLSDNMLADPLQQLYNSLYYSVLPSLIQLKEKQQRSDIKEIELAFVAIYGYLNLKRTGRSISIDTEKAIKNLSTLLAMLADRFRTIEEDEKTYE